ncbi:unnamed protein product [Urochloa humidicola]
MDGGCRWDEVGDVDRDGPARQRPPSVDGTALPTDGPLGDELAAHAARPCAGLPRAVEAQQEAHEEAGDGDNSSFGIEDLFRSPEAVFDAPPPARRPRQRRVFDMSTVRRSARLAKKIAMPAAERAQRNLVRKLGLTEDELAPVEAALKEFIAMFVGPLPEHIIAALTTIFDLNEEGAELLNEALLEHAGEGIHELQVETGQLPA